MGCDLVLFRGGNNSSSNNNNINNNNNSSSSSKVKVRVFLEEVRILRPLLGQRQEEEEEGERICKDLYHSALPSPDQPSGGAQNEKGQPVPYLPTCANTSRLPDPAQPSLSQD